MKTLVSCLTIALILTFASTTSAAVFVSAGPVHVAVGVHPHVIHPHVAVRPIPRPIMAPSPVLVAPPAAAGSPGTITYQEGREIRSEAQDVRREIRQAGSHISPSERWEIRGEVQDLRREIRQARQY